MPDLNDTDFLNKFEIMYKKRNPNNNDNSKRNILTEYLIMAFKDIDMNSNCDCTLPRRNQYIGVQLMTETRKFS